jgi:hypothetical protein
MGIINKSNAPSSSITQQYLNNGNSKSINGLNITHISNIPNNNNSITSTNTNQQFSNSVTEHSSNKKNSFIRKSVEFSE